MKPSSETDIVLSHFLLCRTMTICSRIDLYYLLLLVLSPIKSCLRFLNSPPIDGWSRDYKALLPVAVGGTSAASHPPYVVRNLPNSLVLPRRGRLLAHTFLTPYTIFTVCRQYMDNWSLRRWNAASPHSSLTGHIPRLSGPGLPAKCRIHLRFRVASHHKD